MLDNEERTQSLIGKVPPIKLQVMQLLYSHPRSKAVALAIQSQHSERDIHFVFFIHGLYLDLNSGSVAVEAYLQPMTSDVPSFKPDGTLPVTAEQMAWWRKKLPSMVESARTWTHTAKCEYITEGVPRPGSSPVCSCGKGKVGQDMGKWKEFRACVTRVAVQPMFAVPWLTSTRYIPTEKDYEEKSSESITRTKTATVDVTVAEATPKTTKSTIDACKVCLKKEDAKKCGKCMSVMYCSKACQRNDWKAHKNVCRKKE